MAPIKLVFILLIIFSYVAHNNITNAADVDGIIDGATGAIEDATGVVNDATDIVDGATDAIDDATGAVEDVTNAIDDATDAIENIDETIENAADEAVDNATEAIEDAANEAVDDFIEDATDAVANSEAVADLIENVDAAVAASEGIAEIIDGVGEAIATGEALLSGEAVTEILENVAEAIANGETLEEILAATNEALAAATDEALAGVADIVSADAIAGILADATDAIVAGADPTEIIEEAGDAIANAASEIANLANIASPGQYEIFPPADTSAVTCTPSCVACISCTITIPLNHVTIKEENGRHFRDHHVWMIDTFFTEHVRFAMALMTNQMTTVAMQQVKIIGTFFDAKHQLETQRLFQQLMAEAHKDYQPSEGMCDIGTNTRGLIASERKTNLTQQALANRVMARQLRSGENLTMEDNSDLYSRLGVFKEHFCYQGDNSNNLRTLCIDGSAPRELRNKDVNFTRTIDSNLTLDIDFSKDSGVFSPDLSPDEIATFALMTNLFANDVLQSVGNRVLATGAGDPRATAYKYMALRAVAAKRSVAQNSMSAIIAERAAGDKAIEYAPFLKSTILELGVPEEEIEFIVGTDPSYFAQMEVLTKKLYQNPVFYTELYDKPANVLRKRASIRAISLMQDRDHFKSLLRSEAVLSVILESMLSEEHDRVYKRLKRLKANTPPVTQ